MGKGGNGETILSGHCVSPCFSAIWLARQPLLYVPAPGTHELRDGGNTADMTVPPRSEWARPPGWTSHLKNKRKVGLQEVVQYPCWKVVLTYTAHIYINHSNHLFLLWISRLPCQLQVNTAGEKDRINWLSQCRHVARTYIGYQCSQALMLCSLDCSLSHSPGELFQTFSVSSYLQKLFPNPYSQL